MLDNEYLGAVKRELVVGVQKFALNAFIDDVLEGLASIFVDAEPFPARYEC